MDGGDKPTQPGSHWPEHADVAVIGGGQAGLAIGHFLAREGRDFVILEAATAVGEAWRTRWDSLVLFTPRRYSSLPGLVFPGDPDAYPTRDEVIAYLELNAETFHLPVRTDSHVRSLSRSNGKFVLSGDGARLTADQVVVATGPSGAERPVEADAEFVASQIAAFADTVDGDRGSAATGRTA